MEQCKNCGQTIKSDDKYCSSCGQKTFERLQLKTLLGELASAYFAWDSKLFKTLRLLLFKPGEVSKRYISGKRQTYVAPFRIYFFFSVLFFLSVAIITSGDNDLGFEKGNAHVTIGNDTIDIPTDTLLLLDQHNRLDELPVVEQFESASMKHFTRQLIRLQIKGGSFRKVFQSNLSLMLFLFIPFFGLVLKWFYKKKGYLYIEHLVFGLYFHSFLFFVLFVTLILSRLVGDAFPLLIGLMGTVLYFTVGLKRFYNYQWGWTIVKSILIGGVYTVLSLIFTFGTVLITIWLY